MFPLQFRILVQDTGIGMDEADLKNCLGTIARSGSKEFIEKVRFFLWCGMMLLLYNEHITSNSVRLI